jgi:serine/threonine-protein kinase
MWSEDLELRAGGRVPFYGGGVEDLELLERLGGGGFATVWKAADKGTGKLYALKVIRDIEDKGMGVERIRMEAEVAIASDYVVPVVGLREWSPRTFLILFEYFEGRSLDVWLREEALTPTQQRGIFEQILYGVSDAHRSNIIHRDLKPANILVSDEMKAKLIDFGISKFKDRNITREGVVFGTPYYMAPELFVVGSQRADAASDIYALGQIFFELVTGQCLWRRKGWRRIEDFIAFLRSVPPPTAVMDLELFDCDLYLRAGELLTRMVKIDPSERFSSVEEIIEEIGCGRVALPQPAVGRAFPVLIVESGANRNAQTIVRVDDGSALIMGRADFAGSDQSISRRHLEIRRRGDRYWLRDLASRNGTMVGGNLLQPGAQHELRHGDRVKVGDVFLRFAFMLRPGGGTAVPPVEGGVAL